MELMLNVTYRTDSSFDFEAFSRQVWRTPAPGEITELTRPAGPEGYIGILSDPDDDCVTDTSGEFVAALRDLPGVESVEAEWAIDVEPYLFSEDDAFVASA